MQVLSMEAHGFFVAGAHAMSLAAMIEMLLYAGVIDD